MIAHHHHDTMVNNFSHSPDQVDDKTHHHSDKHHHHHHDSDDEKPKKKDSEKEHNHPFPFHKHVSETNGFDYTRSNGLESNSQVRNIISYTVKDVFPDDFYEPPDLNQNIYEDKPFLITSHFKPGAITLRGPPSIV